MPKAKLRKKPEPPLSATDLAKALGCPATEPFLKEAVASNDPAELRAVLDKVLDVPMSRIRKSRLALFRYLLLNP